MMSMTSKPSKPKCKHKGNTSGKTAAKKKYQIMGKILTDEQLTVLAAKMELRRQWLMSPQGRKRRDQIMRDYMKKTYNGNKRSENGVLTFAGCHDVFEQKEMEHECKAADGTDFVNPDYLKFKQKDFKARGLTGDWLN